MCEKSKEMGHWDVPPLLPSYMNLSINPSVSQTLKVKDKDALNRPHLSSHPFNCNGNISKRIGGLPSPLYLKTSFLKFLPLFRQTFLSVPPVQPFGTGLIFPEPPAAVGAISTQYRVGNFKHKGALQKCQIWLFPASIRLESTLRHQFEKHQTSVSLHFVKKISLHFFFWHESMTQRMSHDLVGNSECVGFVGKLVMN